MAALPPSGRPKPRDLPPPPDGEAVLEQAYRDLAVARAATMAAAATELLRRPNGAS